MGTAIFLVTLQATISLASELNPNLAAQQAINEGLKMPAAQIRDGRIQTLNQKGAMSPVLNYISNEFIIFASKPSMKALEIGASYGIACIEALKLGAQDYTDNDLDARHFKILALRINELNKNYLSKIHLFSSTFPNDVQFPKEYFDAIIARVLHFMKPLEIVEALNEAYKTLKLGGGYIYAIMLSPYVKRFASFVPEFERRLQNNQPFPGYVETLLDVADKSIILENALKNLKKQFLFFDVNSAKACFEQSGFVIEKAIEMPLDGRENIGIIAYKPK